MIYRNSDLSRSINWSPDMNPEAASIALRFLEGERDLMHIAHIRSSSIVDLTSFLTAAAGHDLVVMRGTMGEILVCVNNAAESLLLTGKTADVLSAYLDDEPVMTRDRTDMTIRRRVA